MTASGAAQSPRKSAAIWLRRPITAASGFGISMTPMLGACRGAANKKPRHGARFLGAAPAAVLALSGFEARIGLVDDVDAALAAHDHAVLVALLERFERIGDFHGLGDLVGRPGTYGMNRDRVNGAGTLLRRINPLPERPAPSRRGRGRRRCSCRTGNA